MNIETVIELNHFKARPYQLNLIKAIEEKGFKKAIAVWPRRAGKDIVALNLAVSQCLAKVCTVFYIFPTYSMGRKILWDAIDNEGHRIMDWYIPYELIASKHSQEMKIKFKNGSQLCLLGSDNYDCFDDQTEILTENGWKLFKDLEKTEKVATLKDEFLEYEVPIKHVEYSYDGEMYCCQNSSMDFMVTPNHRFWVKSSKGVYKFKKIEDPTIKHDSIPSKALWKGEDRKEFVFPPISNEWICGKGRKVQQSYSRTMPMEDFVALLGIFLAEGSTYSDHKTYRVSISQTKPAMRDEISKLLIKLGINFQTYKDQFTFEDKQLYEYFSQFGKQYERFIPKEIKNLSFHYLTILFDWLLKGDGHRCKTYIAYYSTSKRLIDDVQEIILKLGFSGNVRIKPQKHTEIKGRLINSKHTLYEVHIRTSNFKRFSSSKKNYIHKKEYKGQVYCVSVPSGVIKVRRNGKEYWSGNSLVGTNCYACIFSEYALQDPRVYQYLRPILVVSGGWALFISTPRGHNALWEMSEIAKNNPNDWFFELLTTRDTGHIDLETIEKEIAEGLISQDLAEQEYFCSFDLGQEGSYYAKYLQKMKIMGRIGEVPYETGYKVHTSWDLGVHDFCVVIFFQIIGAMVRIFDVYANNDVSLDHYAKVLQQKNFLYGKHIAPHDIRVRDFSQTGGQSRLEVARHLGINFVVAPSVPLEDGIESVRATLSSKIWIDERRCNTLLKALENYHREFDPKKKTYKEHPEHDWSSNYADALRYLCLSLSKVANTSNPDELDKRYAEVMQGNNHNIPRPFQDPNSMF